MLDVNIHRAAEQAEESLSHLESGETVAAGTIRSLDERNSMKNILCNTVSFHKMCTI